MSNEWTRDELKAAVEVYLEMQDKEHNEVPFTKKDFYEGLVDRFGRTTSAFEYRMQNISAVLSLRGRSWLTGLKPASHIGARVTEEIESLLDEIEGVATNRTATFQSKVNKLLDKPQVTKPKGNRTPKQSSGESSRYDRDPAVVAWVLREADGVCEACEKSAPFVRDDGSPYLEVHHVIPLAEGGPDTVENAVALCPNCHRELHYGRDRSAMTSKFL